MTYVDAFVLAVPKQSRAQGARPNRRRDVLGWIGWEPLR